MFVQCRQKEQGRSGQDEGLQQSPGGPPPSDALGDKRSPRGLSFPSAEYLEKTTFCLVALSQEGLLMKMAFFYDKDMKEQDRNLKETD